MKPQSRGDVFEGAKISVQHGAPILTHPPLSVPLQPHLHSNNHHNSNGNALQSPSHVVKPRSFSHSSHRDSQPSSNGAASKPRSIKKIRLIIPRKRKLNEMQSEPRTNNTNSPSSSSGSSSIASDSKENKPNQPQQPPLKKQKLSTVSPPHASPTKPPLIPPLHHSPKRHKPQPPSNPSITAPPHVQTTTTPVHNGGPHVQKHDPKISSLPPPPPLQSISPPPTHMNTKRMNNGNRNDTNPYLHLRSQLQTHYEWPSHNAEGVAYTHVCDECGQGFMNGNALGGHKGQHRRAHSTGSKYEKNQYYYPHNYNKKKPAPMQQQQQPRMNHKKKRTIDHHNKRDANGKYPRCDAQGVAYTHFCDVCDKGFSGGSALGGHRSVHKRMKRMGKTYNKATGRHESKEQSSSSSSGTDSSMDNNGISHVAIATHNHVVIEEKEYKEYDGLQKKEIMNKIIEKLCVMDERKLFHCCDTTNEKEEKEAEEESLSFETIRKKIADDTYASVQQDFMADINKLFRCVFKSYTSDDIEYKSALKLKQFAYRQCTAALGVNESKTNKRRRRQNKTQEAHHAQLECLPMSEYDEISDYEFFCDDAVLRDKMKCKKRVKCDGKWCHNLSDLGPYCIHSEQWKSQCLCRSKQMECSDECGCDATKCLNRSIQQKKMKVAGASIREQEVFGIDQHTRMTVASALPKEISDVYPNAEDAKSFFIEKRLCRAINNFLFFVAEHPEFASKYDPSLMTKASESEAPFTMTDVLRSMLFRNGNEAECRVIEYVLRLVRDMACDQLQNEICGVSRSKRRIAFAGDKDTAIINKGYECEYEICHFEFPIYSKGKGVICIDAAGIKCNEYVISFLGVVYAPWCWYEKDDRTRWLVKSRGAPKQAEFFNIMMEKHRDDSDGYDLVFIDPSHKGNYGSRLSHSCAPNCISVSMGVCGKYNIAVYASHDIEYGEELCFNYNSVTESEQEWHDAVCLCGSANCNGQFLIYAGTMLYTQVLKKAHHLLHRTAALFNANKITKLPQCDLDILSRYALLSDGSALCGIPEWMKSYAAAICRYIDYEQCELPKELQLKAAAGEKGYSQFIDCNTAQEESRGLRYVRLSNLVITLNKMNLFFRQPVNRGLMQLPLFAACSDEEIIQRIWFASNSIISHLYCAIAISLSNNHSILHRINEIRSILNHQINIQLSRQYLMEIRNELLKLAPTNAAYHHAASDVLLFYAQTKYFFYFFPPFQGFQSRVFTYDELGYKSNNNNKYAPAKKYAQQYVWGQLNFWERHSIESPDSSLSAERRGAITLPNIQCCYKYDGIRRPYSLHVRKQLITHLQYKHWGSWSSKWHFGFKNGALFGSPWLDQYIDPTNETEKFKRLIQCMKQTKMIYVDGTYTTIAEEEEDEKEEEEEEEKVVIVTNNQNKRKNKKIDNNNNNKISHKATRRSNRLRGKQLPNYIEPKNNEF